MKHFPAFPRHFQVPGGARDWHPKEISQYERAAIALAYVTGWDLAIDVGAFGGAWSYAFAQHFRAVHTFEPSVRNAVCCEQNLSPFPHVTVYNVGLMNVPGIGSMIPGGSKYEYVQPGIGPVTITTLDWYHLSACDLLKIDAEGADALVLHGAQETIAKYSPVIIVEEKGEVTGLFGLKPDAVNTLLTGWGYERVWQHDPDGIYVRKK